MKAKGLKGSLTVEMSVIVPVLLVIFMGIILVVFYYHDKNILNGAAYETAVVGSSKMREKEEITEEELIEFCEERLQGKCIFLTYADIEVCISEDEVLVNLSARKNGIKVSVTKKSVFTQPEKKIRDIRRLDI